MKTTHEPVKPAKPRITARRYVAEVLGEDIAEITHYQRGPRDFQDGSHVYRVVAPGKPIPVEFDDVTPKWAVEQWPTMRLLRIKNE